MNMNMASIVVAKFFRISNFQDSSENHHLNHTGYGGDFLWLDTVVTICGEIRW